MCPACCAADHVPLAEMVYEAEVSHHPDVLEAR
jgi:hypothetical protein